MDYIPAWYVTMSKICSAPAIKSLAEHESIEVYSLSDGTTALLRYRDDQLLGAYLRDKDNVETSIFNQNNAGMTGINGTDSTIGGGADTNGSTNAVTGTDNTNGAGMGTDNTNGAGTGTENGIGGDGHNATHNTTTREGAGGTSRPETILKNHHRHKILQIYLGWGKKINRHRDSIPI